MRSTVVALLAALAIPAVVAAQDARPNVISLQPLNAVFGVYAAEWEHATGAATTIGVGVNYWPLGDNNTQTKYVSGEFKLRYYPEGTALQGFSLGGAIGLSSVSGRDGSGRKVTVGGPSFGVLLEYQWLLGAKDDFAVTIGLGAKSVSVSEAEFASDTDYTAKYPTARLSVGWRF